MEKPLQPCKTVYVRSSAQPTAEVTTIVRCLNAKTLLVRQLPFVFMPACQWRLTNSRVSVRRGERQLFAARHATIDSGGRVTLANYSQHIFKCAWKAGWPAATGVDTPQTAGYHRGIPEAEVTPTTTTPSISPQVPTAALQSELRVAAFQTPRCPNVTHRQLQPDGHWIRSAVNYRAHAPGRYVFWPP